MSQALIQPRSHVLQTVNACSKRFSHLGYALGIPLRAPQVHHHQTAIIPPTTLFQHSSQLYRLIALLASPRLYGRAGRMHETLYLLHRRPSYRKLLYHHDVVYHVFGVKADCMIGMLRFQATLLLLFICIWSGDTQFLPSACSEELYLKTPFLDACYSDQEIRRHKTSQISPELKTRNAYLYDGCEDPRLLIKPSLLSMSQVHQAMPVGLHNFPMKQPGNCDGNAARTI
ncbi:unnamed protein product [Fusarium fujikuroi]|nr:unnamed protein product [Fusarium fujikuroi]